MHLYQYFFPYLFITHIIVMLLRQIYDLQEKFCLLFYVNISCVNNPVAQFFFKQIHSLYLPFDCFLYFLRGYEIGNIIQTNKISLFVFYLCIIFCFVCIAMHNILLTNQLTITNSAPIRFLVSCTVSTGSQKERKMKQSSHTIKTYGIDYFAKYCLNFPQHHVQI